MSAATTDGTRPWCVVPTAAMLLADIGPVEPTTLVDEPTLAAIDQLRTGITRVLHDAYITDGSSLRIGEQARGEPKSGGSDREDRPTTLVVADDAWSLTVAPVADFAPLGLALRRDCLPAPASTIVARPVTAWCHAERYTGDASVLAFHCTNEQPDAALRVLGVPPDAAADDVGAVAEWLAHDQSVVVAAGDLAATLNVSSPGYVVNDAAAWDEAARSMFADATPWTAERRLAFDALGVDAQRVQARGFGPLRVVAALCTLQAVATHAIAYAAPRGVGQLVAGTRP